MTHRVLAALGRVAAGAALVALGAGTLGCGREAPREAVVQFPASATGVAWDEKPPAGPAALEAAKRLLAEGTKRIADGDVLGGVARLRRALDLTPGDGALARTLASHFERLGDDDAALGVLREVLRATPGDGAALVEVGRLVHKSAARREPRSLAEGIEAWQKVLATPPPAGLTPESLALARAGLPALERARREAVARSMKRLGDARPRPNAAPAPSAPALVPIPGATPPGEPRPQAP